MSTSRQSLQRQLDALAGAGIPQQRVYSDTKIAGPASIGPGVTSLLRYAREGDPIVVHTLDRLGRNLREVVNLVQELSGKFSAR